MTDINALIERLADAEMSLAIYDHGRVSEYWLRYPEPIAEQPPATTSPASGSTPKGDGATS